MEIEQIIEKFGVNPKKIGNRYRGHWIVDKVDDEEEYGGAKIGYLCVKARDGGSNVIDIDSLKIPNCVGTSQDNWDCTYQYYYFKPLEQEPPMPSLSDKIDALVNDLPLEAIDKGWLAIQIEELVKAETPLTFDPCLKLIKEVIDITAFSSIGSTAYNVHMYLRNSLPKILEARDASP